MPENIGGVASLSIDGKAFKVAGSLTYSVDAIERESKSGLTGVAGYTETGKPPFIEVELFNTSGIDLGELRAMVDVTVVLQQPNGKGAVWRNAWTTSAHEVNQAEGTFSVRFEALAAEEMSATT